MLRLSFFYKYSFWSIDILDVKSGFLQFAGLETVMRISYFEIYVWYYLNEVVRCSRKSINDEVKCISTSYAKLKWNIKVNDAFCGRHLNFPWVFLCVHVYTCNFKWNIHVIKSITIYSRYSITFKDTVWGLMDHVKTHKNIRFQITSVWPGKSGRDCNLITQI
jgi:hypothetical protein